MNCQTLNVDMTTLPEYNVHNWLDPQSKEYNTTIAEAVFHYHARANMNECFKICISTKEMNEAANKYTHHSQLILNDTDMKERGVLLQVWNEITLLICRFHRLKKVLTGSQGANPEAKSALKGSLSHLDYLNKHRMSVPMWQSWSEWGRVAASVLLNVTVEDVIPTTNHLKSFTAILKRKYILSQSGSDGVTK
ncbi:MAG: hypothetical protein NXY57DRAFT_1066546 [Lentinula lateritia]|nr:MAG: hypothetical protein NXY57DRAFT_1066546 [Lentinula lateritia]